MSLFGILLTYCFFYPYNPDSEYTHILNWDFFMPGKIEKFQLADRILVLDTQGKTTLEIAAILTEELEGRTHISQPTVSRWLKKTRKSRKTAAQHVLEEYLEETLPSDLKLLDEMLTTYLPVFRNKVAGEIAGKSSEKFNLKDRMMSGDRILAIIQTKLRFIGIDGAGDDMDAIHPVDLTQYRTDAEKLKREIATQKAQANE